MSRLSRHVKILPDIGGAYCFVVFGVLFLFEGSRALLDGDTLWHIKMGTVMLERGEILTHDIYSHTAPGQPWTSHEWLSEVLMGAIHQTSGLAGVVIFYFLLVALTFWILFRTVENNGGEWLSIVCVSVGLALSISHLLARPHIFSWLLGVVTLYILKRGGRRLFYLPLTMVLWVNLHGGFVLGLALQGLYISGTILERVSKTSFSNWRIILWEHRFSATILFLSILATGINPFGYELLLFPFEVSKGVFRSSIGEWLPPNLQHYWYFRLYLIFIIFLLFLNGPKITWTNRLYVLFFLNASLTHVRYVSIAGIFLTPFLVEALRPWAQRFENRRQNRADRSELSLSGASGPIAMAILGLGLLAVSTSHWTAWGRFSSRLIHLPEKFSPAAVQFLEENPPQGKLFNQDEWGDYLIYAMDPPPKLFIDGRLDMYGENILKDYLKIKNLTEEVEEVLRSYEIEWVLFPPSPLTRYLVAGGQWEENYRDEQVSILIRRRQ